MERLAKFIGFIHPLLWTALFIYLGVFISNASFENNSIFGVVSSVLKLWLDPFYVDNLQIPIVRCFLILLACYSLLYAAFRDYSRFFPQHFKLDVFFDLQGLVTVMNTFSPYELRSLQLSNRWKDERSRYFETLNRELRQKDLDFEFRPERGGTSGIGDGTIRLKKLNQMALGAQHYKVTEAKGYMSFETERREDGKLLKLTTEYEVAHANTSVVTASARDIIMRRSIIIKPEFKQLIMLSPTTKTTHSFLVMAATKVRLWPRFGIGDTIYLIADPSGGNVPIGYAQYSPE